MVREELHRLHLSAVRFSTHPSGSNLGYHVLLVLRKKDKTECAFRF